MSLSYRKYSLAPGVQKVKTKTGLLLSTFVLAVGSGSGLSLALLGSTYASPVPSTVVVTESSPQGWAKTEANGGTINYVASAGAMGTGAAQFTTTTDDSYTRLRKDVSTNLSDITNLSYTTKQVTVPAAAANVADVNLRLYIDKDGIPNTDGTTFDDVLVYEPYYNNAQQVITAGWQTWSIDQTTGFWWSNSGFTYNGSPTPPPAGGYDTNFHLSAVLAQYPDAKVVSIGLGTGDFNSNWVVQADGLVVNTTTYNFENETTVVPNKDSCKNNGWKTMTNPGPFKNQGDCVSFFATSGKNQPNGH